MKVDVHKSEVPSFTERQLEEFERQFTYPLGDAARFRISHCGDYARFFRAMGECAVITATRGEIVGVMAVALRNLLLPDGVTKRVAYFGDLKIAPGARGGLVFARLGQAAREWVGDRVDAALGIAMDGTGLLPTSYTGRAGFPLFARVSRVAVLRFRAGGAAPDLECEMRDVHACFHRLGRGTHALPVEDTLIRSLMPAVPLMHPGGSACGIVEDTRRGKRLVDEAGRELLSAHLSAFAFDSPGGGAQVIRAACAAVADNGLPALFVAVPMDKAAALVNELAELQPQRASATIYATNLGHGGWHINTSEI